METYIIRLEITTNLIHIKHCIFKTKSEKNAYFSSTILPRFNNLQ